MPQASEQVTAERQRLAALIERRRQQSEEGSRRLQSQADAAQHAQDVGWGKTAMTGLGIGSMFGPTGMAIGGGLGALLGLGKAYGAYKKQGSLGPLAALQAIGNVQGGIIDPIVDNPQLAAGAAKSAYYGSKMGGGSGGNTMGDSATQEYGKNNRNRFKFSGGAAPEQDWSIGPTMGDKNNKKLGGY